MRKSNHSLASGAPLRLPSQHCVVAVLTLVLVLNMALRWLTGEGTATPFVLVATGVLFAGLLGWRAVEALVFRSRDGSGPVPAE